METYGLEEQIMKKVFGVLAFLSFFYLLGVVGAVEQDTMVLGAASGCSVSCPVRFIPPRQEKERAADGTGTSINGKRKSSI